MAFPTSPSNNQIHEETGSNRTYVYDSAIGVWDQVKGKTDVDGSHITGAIKDDVDFPAGHIIKIYSKTMTGVHNVGTSNAWVTVGAGHANSFTFSLEPPKTSASKYFIMCNVMASNSSSGTLDFRLLDGAGNNITRADSTAGNRTRSFIGMGHQSTNNGSVYEIRNCVGHYLWAPGTSAAQTDVRLQCSNVSGTQAYFINRSTNDNNADWQSRSVSTMTIMEIAG